MKRPPAAILLILALTAPASCAPKTRGPGQAREIAPGDTVSRMPPIQDVLARETPSLMAIQGVTGTGQGEVDGKTVIVVYTSHISRQNRIAIPRKIGGYDVDIREIGDVTAPPR
jgi:hypothetical protein